MTKYCFSNRKKIGKIFPRINLNFNFLTNRKAIGALVVVLIIFVGMVYAIQINDLATKGFAVRSLENEIAKLKEENQKLSLQLTELQTMNNVKMRAQSLNLVEVTNLKYIDITPVLAQR